MTAALSVVLAVAVSAAPSDDARAPWRHRRAVSPSPGTSAFASVDVPPEVAAASQPDLRDLRLVAGDGSEVPFTIAAGVARDAELQPAAAQLVDTRSERKASTAWVVDLGAPRDFDRVVLDVVDHDFAKRMRLEASLDRARWTLVQDDVGVFEREWSVRVRHTTIDLERVAHARYLRVTADDSRSRPVALNGVSVATRRSRDAQWWSRNATLHLLESRDGWSRYAVETLPGLRYETLRLAADDPGFSRRVRLSWRVESDGAAADTVLADAVLYRLKLDDAALAGEDLELPVRWPAFRGPAPILEIENRDSPPLRNPRAVLSGPTQRLLFASDGSRLTLYYGNDVTRAPLYDLDSLRARLALEPKLAAAEVGPEEDNPRYAPPAPMPAIATEGAPLDPSGWRRVRPLAAVSREDIYTLTLEPEDLALLRPDLGDVRLVDARDRQIPYVVAAASAVSRVPLQHRVEAPSRRGEPALSVHHLSLTDRVSGRPMTLPLAAVELDAPDAFFDRPARLLAPPALESRGGLRVLFAGRLTRTAGTTPLVIPLNGAVGSELILEIDEGDNAPLTVAAARALVRVPRLAYKAGPGSHRLLLGNSQAEPPRYDIAGLSREVLAYSAVAASAGPAEDNPAFRRSAADYFKQAPPTLLLWGALIAAVVGLLIVTVRILKQPAAP